MVRQPGGEKQLILSWNHALMDARGAELILRHLCLDAGAKSAPTLENLIKPEQRHRSLIGWFRTVGQAHGSIKWLQTSGAEPLFTLLPAAPPVRGCRNGLRAISFSDQETARLNRRNEQIGAGFRRGHFYLAASIRALHAVAVQRGNRDGAYLVPVPHDMRLRRALGPVFSNHLSILFYRIEPRQAGRMSDILSELSCQMMNQVRDKFPECCMAALDMFKPLPLPLYLRQLGKPTRGKFATLCFSDSGETCAGITDVFGGKILKVTHFVPTWPPGLTILFWSFRGRPCALVSWADDCLSPAEVETVERGLRSALLEEDIL